MSETTTRRTETPAAPSLVLDGAPRARRAQIAVPSAVREILKAAESPGMISFAGGLPAAETFPVEAIARAVADVLRTDGDKALQYGVTEGFLPLRSWIAARLAGRGAEVDATGVLVTQGSQQGLDLVSRVLLDPGDVVLVERPTYVAALQVFQSLEARPVAVPSDAEGLDPAALEEAILRHRPKFLYAMPTFQNPTGASYSLARCRQLLELAVRHRLPIVEDDPYGEIRFAGVRRPTLFELDRHGAVVYLSTFSKTLAPGLRLGYVAARGSILRSVTVAKQAADLHSPTLNQRAAARLLETFDFEAHLGEVRALYAARATAMDEALAQLRPLGVRWVKPEGGLFFWVEVPASTNVRRLFERALEKQVAFVPGSAFFPDWPNAPFLRLNFSHRSEEVIREGVRRLGKAMVEVG